MTVVLDAQPEKYLDRQTPKAKARLGAALNDLAKDPPEGDIIPLQGRNDYRLRVGGTRILFSIEKDTIVVSKIIPRGQAYKGKGKHK